MNKPECLEFAMDFLGETESKAIREYIELLEKRIRDLEQELKEKADVWTR